MSSWFNDNDVPKNLKAHARRLYEYFEPKRAFVVRVTCLYNFGPSNFGYRGCSIQLKPTYVLSEEDRIWIHADLFKSTTVALCNVRSDTMDSKLDAVRERVWAVADLRGDNDFGVYVERRARDYSSALEHVYHAILTQTPSLDVVPLEGTLEQWIAQLRAAYTAVNAREDAMSIITSIFPKATCLDHKTTNMFIRDNSTWRFVNSVWNVRPSETDIFVRTHPSVGLLAVHARGNQPLQNDSHRHGLHGRGDLDGGYGLREGPAYPRDAPMGFQPTRSRARADGGPTLAPRRAVAGHGHLRPHALAYARG